MPKHTKYNTFSDSTRKKDKIRRFSITDHTHPHGTPTMCAEDALSYIVKSMGFDPMTLISLQFLQDAPSGSKLTLVVNGYQFQIVRTGDQPPFSDQIGAEDNATGPEGDHE